MKTRITTSGFNRNLWPNKRKRETRTVKIKKKQRQENIFYDIFSIEEVGIYKPDIKVYDMPVKKYQITADKVAFLSANTWDVSGGGNYGYKAIWVNRNNNIFDNLDYKPKNEISNLTQLLGII